jgi:hypothetical protein
MDQPASRSARAEFDHSTTGETDTDTCASPKGKVQVSRQLSPAGQVGDGQITSTDIIEWDDDSAGCEDGGEVKATVQLDMFRSLRAYISSRSAFSSAASQADHAGLPLPDTTAKASGGRRNNARWEGAYVSVAEANDAVMQDDMSSNSSLDSVSEAGCVSEQKPGTDA